MGVAASTSLKVARQLLGQTEARGIDANDTLPEIEARQHLAQLYSESYAQYCWPVASIDDIRLAPFQLMASEGQVQGLDDGHVRHRRGCSGPYAHHEALSLRVAQQAHHSLTSELIRLASAGST